MALENKKQKRFLKRRKSYEDKVIGAGRKKSNPTAKFLSRFLFYFLILIFFGTTGYLIFFSGFLTISKIEIQGGEEARREYVRNFVNSELEGNCWDFLEKNNMLLFSGRKAEREITESLKIISKVEIKKKFPDSVKIIIEEKNIQAIVSSAGKKWVIDENGAAFDEAQEDFTYMGRSNLPVIFDRSNKSFFLGENIFDKEYIKFITDFRKMAEEDIEIDFENEIQVPNISSGDIRMKTKEGWTILLDKNMGAQKEKEMLQVVLENKIEKEKRPDLEYIDIRIPNKVYYKFKDNGSEEVLENSNESALQIPPAENKEDKKKTKKKD